MDGKQFVEQLRGEIDFLLAKLDVPPVLSGTALEGRGGTMAPLAALLKIAMKNEMEATVIAAEWVASTPEFEAKLAFAAHAGDEARHYQFLEEKARALGVLLLGFNPLSPESPLLAYLRTLNLTVERVAAALVAREAMGRRRNVQFLKYLEAIGQKDLGRLYRDVINPDEDKHHQAGCAVLAKLASTGALQEQARRACKRLLEIGDQARTSTMEKTGAPVVPGC